MSTNINKKEIFKYLVMPQLAGRFKDLFASGFRYIPFFIALVYQCVRILPTNHPYVNAENIGQFGMRHVIAEAANNIKVNRQNIDQILLFGMVLLGLGILVMQIFMMAFGLFVQPVMAAASPEIFRFFKITHPQHDLAYMFLDLVFGLPKEMFGSCVSLGQACMDMQDGKMAQMLPHYPSPAHVGMHQMFQIYSLGLLVVAVFITLYFITTIIAETAQTGTPMGKRFNKVWAPIRLVVAFGLLVPVNSGLNSAQYLVLHAAKYGSNFATNGWTLFNETLSKRYTDGAESMLIAQPNIPEVGTLLQFVYTARTCLETHKARYSQYYEGGAEENIDKQIWPYLVSSKNAVLATENHKRVIPPTLNGATFNASTYDGNSQAHQDAIKSALPYKDMIAFAQGRNSLKLRFGVRDSEAYPIQKGNVFPVCGELTFNLEDPRPPQENNGGATSAQSTSAIGPQILQSYYWFVIKELWFTNGVFDKKVNYPKQHVANANVTPEDGPHGILYNYTDASGNTTLKIPAPTPDLRTSLQSFYQRDLHYMVTGKGYGDFLNKTKGAIEEQNFSSRWEVDDALKQKGWGGAAIWYNKIAEMNGPITGAILNVPSPTKYPNIMETVKHKKSRYDKNVVAAERFNPVLAGTEFFTLEQADDKRDAESMYKAFKYWQEGGLVSTSHSDATGNPVLDVINAILGTNGLFSMRNNQNVHPLAQIVGVGKGLVDSSIGNLGKAGIISIGGAALSKVLSMPSIAGFSGAISGFMITITMIGLTAGFILFYIVPFLPFIYFFFALGGWIKGIFEAMVGAPLWALAHLRIDGDGLSGKDAANGYYLIFEIFLRPILVIFGFLASVTTFSAIISVLNDIFTLVTDNLTGFDVAAADAGWTDIDTYRGTIDEFFYTIVYAIIVYLTGMASFKLIDQIPNSILRWMGQSIQTFNDAREDPAEKMVSTATIGSQQAFEKIGGGLGKINSSITQIGQS